MAWDDNTPPSYADCILHLIDTKGPIAFRTRATFTLDETLENDPKYAEVSELFNEQAALHGDLRTSEAFAQTALKLLQQEKRDAELKEELGEEAYEAHHAQLDRIANLKQRVADSSQRKADLMNYSAELTQKRATAQQVIAGLEAHGDPVVAKLSREIAETTTQIAEVMQERAVLAQKTADVAQQDADLQAI